jgi:hypothetical protein
LRRPFYVRLLTQTTFGCWIAALKTEVASTLLGRNANGDLSPLGRGRHFFALMPGEHSSGAPGFRVALPRNKQFHGALPIMQQDLVAFVVIAVGAGAFIGFFLGYAVRAAISRRRRRRAMLGRGWA